MSQGPYTGPPQRSGGGAGTVIVVLLVFAVLGLLCLGLCGFGMFWGVRQASDVATNLADQFGDAMQATLLKVQADMSVQADARVTEKLGQPLSFGEPTGENMNLPAGTIVFDSDVSGTKAKATMHVEGQREGKEWKIKSLKVTFSDGMTIDVDASRTIPLDQYNNVPLEERIPAATESSPSPEAEPKPENESIDTESTETAP
jgi:cytochrome oxidase complex assembly protein 1